MITSDIAFTLRTGTKTQLDPAVQLYTKAIIDPAEGRYRVDVRAMYDGTQVDGANFDLELSRILSYTASGADEMERIFNQIEQTVVRELQLMSENSAATFTIS